MLPNAAPKPPKTEPKPKKELKRSSPVARSTRLNRTKQGKQVKPIPKVNKKAQAKRRDALRAHYASKEYRDAKAVAHVRAEGQCEAWHVFDRWSYLIAQLLPGEAQKKPDGGWIRRCAATKGLQFHETVYGSDLGVIRDIAGFILCEGDHGYIERTRHPTRSNGRSV